MDHHLSGSPPNLEDGELWLPSDILEEIIVPSSIAKPGHGAPHAVSHAVSSANETPPNVDNRFQIGRQSAPPATAQKNTRKGRGKDQGPSLRKAPPGVPRGNPPPVMQHAPTPPYAPCNARFSAVRPPSHLQAGKLKDWEDNKKLHEFWPEDAENSTKPQK